MKAVATLEGKAVTPAGVNFDLVARWIKFAQVKASSRKTYEKGARSLQKFFADNHITQPTREDVINYREYLENHHKSAATAQVYFVGARLFLSWLAAENFIPDCTSRVKGVKVEHSGHKKNAFAAGDIKTIADSIDTSRLQGKRDMALLALMSTAGLRTIEVIRADCGDFERIDGKMYLRVWGKGRSDKSALVRVVPRVYALIQEYLRARGKVEANAPLFASCSNRNFGGRLTTQSVSRAMKSRFKNAGFDSPKLTAHSLRHTAATQALKNGAQLREVQQMLRHKSIVVTEGYLHDLSRVNNTAEEKAAAAVGF